MKFTGDTHPESGGVRTSFPVTRTTADAHLIAALVNVE